MPRIRSSVCFLCRLSFATKNFLFSFMFRFAASARNSLAVTLHGRGSRNMADSVKLATIWCKFFILFEFRIKIIFLFFCFSTFDGHRGLRFLSISGKFVSKIFIVGGISPIYYFDDLLTNVFSSEMSAV